MADPEEGKRKHDEAAGNKGIHYFVSAGAFKRLQIQKTLFFLFQSAAKKADLCAANQSLQHIFLPPMRKKRADSPSKY